MPSSRLRANSRHHLGLYRRLHRCQFVMFINDCPKTVDGANGDCVPRFLRRFSLQPLRENPLLGPSSSTLEKMGLWLLIPC
ncbi:unnamed protein product [Brassica rapa subsp. trilocularis]